MEFAVVSLIFILMVLGVVELGRYFFTAQSLRTATAEAARASIVLANRRMVIGNDCASLAVADVTPAAADVLARTPFLDASNFTLSVSSLSCTPPRTVTVDTAYNFSFLFVFIRSGSVTLTERLALTFP